MSAVDRFSLADTLSFALKALPPELADPAGHDCLMKLAAKLPPIAHILLECRLGKPGPVDLSLCVANGEIDRSLLRHYLLQDSAANNRCQPLSNFLRWWCDANPPDSGLKSAWLEFDVDSKTDTLTPPAVFLSVNQTLEPLSATAIGAGEALEKLQTGGNDRLNHWLARLPAGAIPTFIGVMLSRSASALRLNLAGLTAESAWTWLTRYGALTDDANRELFLQVYKLAGKPILCVDIDDQLGPRIGLECRPETQQNTQSMYNILAQHNVCGTAQFEAVQNWTGHDSPFDTHDEWPLHLVLESMIRTSAGASALVRQVNHVKIVFETTGITEAKIYLGLNHAVYSLKTQASTP